MVRYALFILALGTGVLSAPGMALACADGDEVLFSCITSSAERYIAICGQRNGDNSWRGAYYQYVTEKGVELSFPEDPAESRHALFFAHYYQDGRYQMSLRFENRGYTYRLFYRDADSLNEDGNESGPAAGVDVLKKGKLVATVACGERPTNYFDDIRRVSACDETTPLGPRACAEQAEDLK